MTVGSADGGGGCSSGPPPDGRPPEAPPERQPGKPPRARLSTIDLIRSVNRWRDLRLVVLGGLLALVLVTVIAIVLPRLIVRDGTRYYRTAAETGGDAKPSDAAAQDDADESAPQPETAPEPPSPSPSREVKPKRPPPARQRLDMEDVVSRASRYSSWTLRCLERAVEREQIKPGSLLLTLEWKITPEGTVSAPRLTSPDTLRSTELAKCVEGAVKRWRFPRSRNGLTVTDFPIGPINIQ